MLNRKTGLIALLVSVIAGEVMAGDFNNYVTGDVLLNFRKNGGANDLVVDIGPVATLTNLPVNTRYAITNYTGVKGTNLLVAIGTNGINWSAFSWFNDNTLFMSEARSSLNVQSTPWDVVGSASAHNVVVDMKPIPTGASANLTTDARSIPAAVIEPDSSTIYIHGLSYHDAIFNNGQDNPPDFGGDFEGSPELVVPSNFTTSGKVVRSDFYQIPISGSTVFLGYFEFNTNGVMTYVAYPTAPVVQTLAASPVATTMAQLNASVNPTNDNTTFFFQYGFTTGYGSTSLSNSIGTIAGSYGLSISNLTAATQYHFRVAAYNQYGTNYGGDLTFTTTGSSAPAVPVITYFNRTTTLTTIAYTTGLGGTYTLRGTNNLANAGARINWPAIASVVGDGLIHTNTDPDVSGAKFYIISAQ
jgi:hypothetical protein